MDPRRQSPSVERNRAPILAVLQRVLPLDAHVLELASGTGEHAVFFGETLPGVTWHTSDPDPDARDSIAAWIRSEGVANVLPPRAIDVSAAEWDVAGPFDAMVAINMIHISPWEATPGLMAGAGRLLRSGGVLFTYGPYKRGGAHTAPSNETFDQWLKQRDPRFGVRDLEDVEAAARMHEINLREIIEMPANNLSLVFER